MKIGILGTGAIGGYYGGKLAHGGRDVHFLVRGDPKEFRRHGLRIRSKEENFRVAKLNCHNSTQEIGPCDLVLIAVKATSNQSILDLVPPLLHERTMLVTLQNGLGNEEFLAENFGADRVLGALCFICLNRISPGEIERYDYGHVVLGEFRRHPLPRTRDMASEFKRCGVKCKVADDLALERWRKLVWNIPFNGLAVAAGKIDTAQILADKSLRGRALALMREVIDGAKRCGHSLPDSVADDMVRNTETMGAYKPSTLIDFEAGKDLEIEAIWGEPLRRATAAGAKMPQLEQLYRTLKELDQRNRS